MSSYHLRDIDSESISDSSCASVSNLSDLSVVSLHSEFIISESELNYSESSETETISSNESLISIKREMSDLLDGVPNTPDSEHMDTNAETASGFVKGNY